MAMQECLYHPKDNAWTNWTAVSTDRISSIIAEMIAITGYLRKQMHGYPAPWFQYLNVSSYQRLVSHDCVFILLFWDSRFFRSWLICSSDSIKQIGCFTEQINCAFFNCKLDFFFGAIQSVKFLDDWVAFSFLIYMYICTTWLGTELLIYINVLLFKLYSKINSTVWCQIGF